MVGTLQCRTKNSYAVSLYNTFITKQRGILDANAQVLKTRFLREEGAKGGQAAYDRYATALANANSADSGSSDYCSNMDTLVRMATAASQPDLLVLAQTMSAAPVSGPCSPSYYALAEGKVVEQPSAAAPVEPTPEPEPVAAEPAQPAETSEAAKPAAVETVSAAAPAPATQQDALQAAIVALQSATAALQAASASSAADSGSEANQAVIVKVADAPVVPPKEAENE